MRKHLRNFSILACAFCVSIGCIAQVPHSTHALFGRVIDGTGRDPIQDGVVLVAGERIVAVGTRETVEIPEGAICIDIQDATILPGFIDTHVHKSYDANLLAAYARAGVTTARDLGGDINLDWNAERDRLAEDPSLATLIISGPLLSVPDGYAMVHELSCGLAVTSIADATIVTQRLIRQGVDIIKIGLESVVQDGQGVMSLEIASAIVAAAHALETAVIAHATYEQDILKAIAAGVDQIAHSPKGAVRISTMQALVDLGIAITTTIHKPLARTIRPESSAQLRHFFNMGGTVLLGTDNGTVGPPAIGFPTAELECMLASGLSEMDVIVASTRNGAWACGLLDEFGTLEPGKRADILVVSGNPLDDITVLGEAAFVMHKGFVVKRPEAN